MSGRSFGTNIVEKSAPRVPNAAVSAMLKEKVASTTKVAGCDVADIRKAAGSSAGRTCNGSGDFSNPDYLGPTAAIQSLTNAADTTFTLTAVNMPFQVAKLIISVASKGVISVKSIKIAGVEKLLNGEILADEFDPQAEDTDCPVNLMGCVLQVNQSMTVTLHNYGAAAVLGGVMAKGLT